MSCPICCEKFNKRNNLAITCPNPQCGQQACRTCVKTYLLNSIQDPHCMSCKAGWDQGFVKESITANFLKSPEYINHRKELLFEREKGKIPGTQEKVTTEVEARRLEKLNIQDGITIAQLEEQIAEMRIARQARADTITLIRTGKKKQAKREFIMPCPDEGCKGFLSTGYKCNICEKFSCSKCLVVMGMSKDENHVCDEDLVATVEEIKKNSKPCPKCGVSTSKIDGCNQMWCVECHATWDWRTGNLVNGVIHNPHYYQWARNNSANGEIPRQPGDLGGLQQNPCENLNLNWNFLKNLNFCEPSNVPGENTIVVNNVLKSRHMRNEYIDCTKIDTFANFTRLIIHYRQEEIPTFQRRLNINNDNERVKYILGDHTDYSFKELIYREDEQRKRIVDEVQIIEMFQHCATDIIRKMIPFNRPNALSAATLTEVTPDMLAEFKQAVDVIYNELVALINYCNGELRRFSVNHNASVKQFCPMSRSGYAIKYNGIIKTFKFTKTQLKEVPFKYNESQTEDLTNLSLEFLTGKPCLHISDKVKIVNPKSILDGRIGIIDSGDKWVKGKAGWAILLTGEIRPVMVEDSYIHSFTDDTVDEGYSIKSIVEIVDLPGRQGTIPHSLNGATGILTKCIIKDDCIRWAVYIKEHSKTYAVLPKNMKIIHADHLYNTYAPSGTFVPLDRRHYNPDETPSEEEAAGAGPAPEKKPPARHLQTWFVAFELQRRVEELTGAAGLEGHWARQIEVARELLRRYDGFRRMGAGYTESAAARELQDRMGTLADALGGQGRNALERDREADRKERWRKDLYDRDQNAPLHLTANIVDNTIENIENHVA